MSRLLALALFFGCASSAFAYGVATGTVTAVRVDADGRGMVTITPAVTGSRPSCSSTYPNAFAFDSSTPGGKSILAMALAAKATGDMINVVGTNNCLVYGGNYVEDWSYGQLQ